MGEETLSTAGVVDAPQGGIPPAGDGGSGGLPSTPAPAKRITPKSPGRGSRADEVARHLEKTGMVAVPADVAAALNGAGLFPDGPAGQSPSPGGAPDTGPAGAEAPESFNEPRTRAGVEALATIADETADGIIAAKASFLGERTAAEFGKRARCPANLRPTLVDTAVDVCRAHNVNIAPELVLGGIALAWMRQIKSLGADLDKLKAVQPTTPAKPAE